MVDLNEVKNNIKEIVGLKTEVLNEDYKTIDSNSFNSIAQNKVNLAMDSLINSKLKAIILIGSGGNGKTYAVNSYLKTLKGYKIHILNGYITPTALFQFLKKHSNKDDLIIFRDIDVFKKSTIGYFKAILDEPYIVSRYSLRDEELNGSFKFQAKICIELNSLGKVDFDLKAILTRTILVDVNLSINEISDIILKIGNNSELAKKYLELTNIPNIRDYKFVAENPDLLNLKRGLLELQPAQLIGFGKPFKTAHLKRLLLIGNYVNSYRTASRIVKDWLERGLLTIITEEGTKLNIETDIGFLSYIKNHRNFMIMAEKED